MNKQIKLYVKCHNETRKMYFGKTSSEDINEYKGSGVYWTNHINKHSYNVNTICIGTYGESDPMLIQHALGFSACNDIVNSDNWANLKAENGLDGGFDYINNISKREHTIRSIHANEVRNKKLDRELFSINIKKTCLKKYNVVSSLNIPAVRMKCKKYWSDYYRDGGVGTFKNKNHTEESKEKMRGDRPKSKGIKNSQYGSMWIYSLELKESKKVPKGDIPDGWLKGRKMKFPN